MGDPTGVKNYREVDTAPLEKWKTTINNNPLRKMWCRRYLSWIGEERLKVMGYRFQRVALRARLNRDDAAQFVFGHRQGGLENQRSS